MKEIWLIFAILSSSLCGERYFRPPELEKELFDRNLVSLDKFDRAALIGNLIVIARDFEDQKGMTNDLRSHTLAIAGRVAPDSKRLKETLEAVVNEGGAYRDSGASRDWVQKDIYQYCLTLAEEGEDSQKLSAYLVDIARRFHPEGPNSKELLTLQEDFSSKGVTADWKGLLLAPVLVESNDPWEEFMEGLNRFKPRQVSLPGGRAEGVARSQATILGLCTLTLPSGKEVGDGLRVMLSALPEPKASDVLIVIDQDVGQGVDSSLQELEKFVRLRHSNLPSGYRWEIVFETKLKDGVVDGNSCGLAMAILLDSIMAGHDIDGEFCCTGAITSDGRVEAIGGVVQKMKAAVRRGAKLAVLPKDNRKQIGDLILLEGLDSILELEIFTVTSFEEALALAQPQRNADLTEARELYASIVGVIQKNGEEILSNAKVQERIDLVLEKAPNHLSASYLKEWAQGEKPTRLSVLGSLGIIQSEVQLAMSSLGELYRQAYSLQNGEPVDASQFKKSLEETRSTILGQEETLNPATEPVVEAAVDLLDFFKEMSQLPTSDEVGNQYRAYVEAFQELARDPKYR